ncbi:MAG: TldD/PmbA family protein, partial [Deltaproteobacteria bacterium]|nr:TldD/PmbA family protein [Deltaproteobacteria bacterium]
MSSKLLETAKHAAQMAQKAGASDARAWAWRSRDVEVEWRDGKLDRIRDNTTRGISVSLYVDGRYSGNSTADLRDDAVATFIQNSVKMTRHLAKDEHRRLPDPARYEGMTTKDLGIMDPSISTINPENRLKLASDLEQSARAGDKGEIISVTSSVSDTEADVACVNTNGFEGERQSTSFWHSVTASIKDQDDRKPRGSAWGGGRALKDIPDISGLGEDALERARAQVGAKQISTGVYDVVIENRCVPTFSRHLMSPLNGSSLQQKRSYYEGQLGKQIGSKHLTITSDPHLHGGLGSRAWDGEGMASMPRLVFDKGVLKTFFLDTYYASKLKMDPTTSSMSNLVWDQGKRNLDKLIKKIK